MKQKVLAGGMILLIGLVGVVYAQSPGGSHAFGKSLDEWMMLDNTWRLGGVQANPEGKMVFLPDIFSPDIYGIEIVDEEDFFSFSAHVDVELKTSQKVAMPLIYFYGEAYDDGTEDDPDEFTIADYLGPFDVKVWVDGVLVLDTGSDGIEDYLYGPIDFEEPIEYDTPIYREQVDKDAVSAIWTSGYGFVHHPFSKGEHTIVWQLFADGETSGFGYDIENKLTINLDVGK